MNLTLTELHTGLVDLRDVRMHHVETLLAGPVYRKLLLDKLVELQQRSGGSSGPQPLAAELSAADAVHDSAGRAIWLYLGAMLEAPSISQEQKAAAKRLREAFVPELRELRAKYALEIRRAQDRRPLLESMSGDLAQFPVEEGKTLASWVHQMLDAADEINRLLSQRAILVARSQGRTGAQGMAFRGEILGLLRRLRAAIRDEMMARPELPRNLESLVFGYFEELARLGKSGRASARSTASPEAVEASGEAEETDSEGPA